MAWRHKKLLKINGEIIQGKCESVPVSTTMNVGGG